MPAIEIHPELADEQSYVNAAYQFMEAMLETVERFGAHGRNDFERDAFDRWKRARIASLSDTHSALVFGRLDHRDDERHYVGRRHVKDAEGEVVVVDWRAPVSQAFYQASARNPMDLRRRRQFLADGREILGIADDDLNGGSGVGVDGVRGAVVLDAELRRRRTGEMRDIVATIQAEQDLIIRSPLEGVVVVQGGPGTGKTAIGLHRASFLLYEHRDVLVRLGVLVVGPNPTFMRYIAQVLPSLGEFAVTQRTIHDLTPLVRATARDEPAVERLKGDARIAKVIARALMLRARAIQEDVSFRMDGRLYVLTADRVNAQVEEVRALGMPHRDGREGLRGRLLASLYAIYQDAVSMGSTVLGYEEVTSRLRKTPEFQRVLARVWPAVGHEALVGDLLASPARMQAAADGILDAAEIKALHRRGARGSFAIADRPLIDEADSLIAGAPRKFGHLVVDEAQDLSPMQLRMLARRCPSGSMTVLGDLGQATGVWGHYRWSEVLEHLPQPAGARVEELTLGYRVSASIMQIASAVLAEVAPDLRTPIAVRAETGVVRFIRTDVAQIGENAAALARAMAEGSGLTAVIAAGPSLGAVRAALQATGTDFGEAARDGLSKQLTLVPAAEAKGLEFDGVVLIEPAEIVREHAGGLRLLYVAITRAMRDLVIVHAQDLPRALERAREGGVNSPR